MDVDIIATDDFSWHKSEQYTKWNSLVASVEELDAVESVKKYGKDIDILIIAWPYMDDTAYRVIKELYEVNPNTLVIYCGEDFGGCTADDKFFDYFEEIKDKTFEDAAENYKSWYGIHDRIALGRYKR